MWEFLAAENKHPPPPSYSKKERAQFNHIKQRQSFKKIRGRG